MGGIKMKNLYNSDYRILGLETFEKDTKEGKKIYYTVKLYVEYSEIILTCFVDKVMYDKIKNKEITDNNIKEHFILKIDKDMKCHIFINL